jgi:hypothetical protein
MRGSCGGVLAALAGQFFIGGPEGKIHEDLEIDKKCLRFISQANQHG